MPRSCKFGLHSKRMSDEGYCESRISARITEKMPETTFGKPDAETISSWSYEWKVMQ